MSASLNIDTSVFYHAIKAAKNVFTFTSKLPLEQRFVFINQLNRSIILICNSLNAVNTCESRQLLKWNIEILVKVYSEIKTQIKMSQKIGGFNHTELANLEQYLDQILISCKSNLVLR